MRVCLLCQQESMPFAVVGSDKEYQVNGKRVLGRKTPKWISPGPGTEQVLNKQWLN